jgi:phage-related holin
MKPGWGVGIIVAILLSVAVWLFGIVNLAGMVSMVLLLCGLWTLVASFAIVELKDRSYYMGWGVVIAALSLFDFIPFNYTIALILMAIVALIIINVYLGRTPKMYEAATTPTPSGGGTPVATAL